MAGIGLGSVRFAMEMVPDVVSRLPFRMVLPSAEIAMRYGIHRLPLPN